MRMLNRCIVAVVALLVLVPSSAASESLRFAGLNYGKTNMGKTFDDRLSVDFDDDSLVGARFLSLSADAGGGAGYGFGLAYNRADLGDASTGGDTSIGLEYSYFSIGGYLALVDEHAGGGRSAAYIGPELALGLDFEYDCSNAGPGQGICQTADNFTEDGSALLGSVGFVTQAKSGLVIGIEGRYFASVVDEDSHTEWNAMLGLSF